MYQDIMDTIGFVEKYDSEVGQAMDKELKRQQRNLELIASENIVSPAVMAAMGSILTNKYAEGYSGKRYYGGCEFVDIVEDIAQTCLRIIWSRACKRSASFRCTGKYGCLLCIFKAGRYSHGYEFVRRRTFNPWLTCEYVR